MAPAPTRRDVATGQYRLINNKEQPESGPEEDIFQADADRLRALT